MAYANDSDQAKDAYVRRHATATRAVCRARAAMERLTKCPGRQCSILTFGRAPKWPRAGAELHGTADGGRDGDDGSVLSTRL